MPQCKHGEKVYKEGRSAKGPWQAYFCPAPKGTPDQCSPEWIRPGQQSPEQKFNTSLDKMVAQEANEEKDERITRLAIAKSLIESGRTADPSTFNEAQRWLDWVDKKAMHAEPTINLDEF